MRVQLAGRLVRQQERRIVGQRHTDRNALLLAARELIGTLLALVHEADSLEQLQRPITRVVAGPTSENHRNFNVLLRAEVRNQVATGLLPDEPHFLASVVNELLLSQCQQVSLVHVCLASRRHVEPRKHVEQCRLARP